MVMSDTFQLSQGSLQDYDDCRRRFYYRYILKKTWPAVAAQPALEIEELIRNGKDFHTVIHQYLSGVPRQVIENSGLLQGKLLTWWQNFLDIGIRPGKDIYPEKSLSVRLNDVKLVAKFDLIVVDEMGGATIYDWKTTSRKPSHVALAERWQTKVYLYTLAANLEHIDNQLASSPENIKMVYWLANFPNQPVAFEYSSGKMEEDRISLLGIIEDMKSRTGIESFELTQNQALCKYCVYRSLCDRGTTAGLHPDVEFEHNVEDLIDFDEIEEIVF